MIKMVDVSLVTFFDLESDGLYQEASKVHCISVKQGHGEAKLYDTPEGITSAIKMLSEVPYPCAHNGINFDASLIRKLFGINFLNKCIDTLVLSCLFTPERFGGHSLDNLAKAAGSYKGEYTGGWETYTPEMGAYCLQDSVSLYHVYKMLAKEAEGHNWEQAIALEHSVARLISWQEKSGWLFDIKAARQFIENMNQKIADADEKLSHLIKPKVVKKGDRKTPITPFTAAGKPSSAAEKWCVDNGLDASIIGGPFYPMEVVYPDLGSRQQMIELLQQYGWKPTEFTEKGNPKLTEDTVVGMMGEVGQLLFDRFVMVTRRSQVGGWLGKVRVDGRIEAGAFPNATPTARMRHKTVVNVPRVTSAYGPELRALFTVPRNRVQVGADASGLELRMLAHYMGDAAYTDAIVNGKSSNETDVHSINCKLIGLEPKKQYIFGGKETSGRDVAKTFIYALLYGAGDAKLGSIIDGDEKMGARMRKKFFKGLPKYAELIDKVKIAAKKGWLKGLDGRKIYVRHQHAALNSLLQSAGSISVKVSMAKWAYELAAKGVPFKLLGTFHDEIQAETTPEHAEMVGQAFVQACGWAGKHLKVACPLSGEYMVGKNWAECH